MSEREDAVSPGSHEKRNSSPDTSEQETDSFEDAVDNTDSVRSLTKRKASGRQRSEPGSPEPGETVVPSIARAAEPAEEVATAKNDDTDIRRESSPRPTRISNNSGDLDIVNLDDESAASTREEEKSVAEKQPSRTISLSSITGALPSLPWSPGAGEPPPKIIANATGPAPPLPSRKLTSPFAWLSRNSQKDVNAMSPPAAISPRRNTASSIATLTSNPEMMLSRLEEEREEGEAGAAGSAGNSLRDRFKLLRMKEEADRFRLLRMKEEAGIAAMSGEEGQPAEALGVLAPMDTVSEERDGLTAVLPQPPPPPASPLPTSPKPGLAPGTASGVNAGPSSMADAPVDWDLWQSVVNEGPAAVARTSPEELNRAIATGIPNAIRGVIWQVLAQSKNDELEAVYRELAARGTDKEVNNRQSNSSASPSVKEPASSASSASSVRSDQSSGMGANGVSPLPPPPPEKDAEVAQKTQAAAAAAAAAAAERKKKDKEDAAMLSRLEKAIRRDLGARTSYSKYAAAQGLQEGLFGVCKAYALFDEGAGYAQGMNFLVMPLLFNMPPEEAFCLLVRLMNHYRLRDLFIQDMPGLHMHLYQFGRLLEDLEPALYCHLQRRGISPHLYATQWFLTLFAYRFPLQLVLRIYDLILSEGLSAVLRFGIVLMQKNSAALLAMADMAQLTAFLKDRLFDVYIDAAPTAGSILENGFFGSSSASIEKEVYRADQLVRDACEVRMTPELLRLYTAEWEDKTRAEREREAELEGLRTGNAVLTSRLRRLEERIEAVDGEQAALATELVHTKVDNEELRDENESLKGQVRELRIVIEKQPADLEEAWRLERDDLMRRNAKVHDENQRLEKELAELEEELVQTKMRYAEINSQHETLNRKWSDVKRQFV